MPRTTRFLDLPDGRLAYDDTEGDGPLVICLPGLGDVRAEYRHLAPLLEAEHFRTVTLDLRGHGESTAAWPSYGPEAVGADLVALLDHLDARGAVLVGESLAAAAAVWAAAERPERVRALVLCGPFVRDPETSWLQRATLRLTLPLLTPWAWARFLRGLFPTGGPDDLDWHLDAVRTNLAEPGRMRALKQMATASKSACEARIPEVRCPTLVLMGTSDRDFPDPAAEARWIGERLPGEVRMFEGVGHYPQLERPAEAAGAIAAFLAARA